MHLLVTKKGHLSQFDEAIDLNQTKADVLFLSFADSELNGIAQAFSLKDFGFSLRLVNLASLTHFFSIDLYVKKTARFAKLIIVRLLGGKPYWSYGVETLHQLALKYGIGLIFLSGDDFYDTQLEHFSTIDVNDGQNLWRYLVEGGSKNSTNFLLYCHFLLKGGIKPLQAIKIPRADFWYFQQDFLSFQKEKEFFSQNSKKKIGICFYRALVQSGQTKPIEALIKGIEKKGAIAVPFYVTSLKNSESLSFLEDFLNQNPIDLIINLTGFSVSMRQGTFCSTILDQNGRMVLQAFLANSSYKIWKESEKGINARDLVMHVALPEMDGRLLTRAIAFKIVDFYDMATQCNLVTYQPVINRIQFVVGLAMNWIKLKKIIPQKKKIAFLFANYPNHEGRIGHAVGLNSFYSLFYILKEMQNIGYTIKNLPLTPELLTQLCLDFFSKSDKKLNSDLDQKQKDYAFLSLKRYKFFFSQLPKKAQKLILARWGEPENDAGFEPRGFRITVLKFGAILVGLQPDRTFTKHGDVDLEIKKANYHDLELAPPHHYMAFYFWLRFIYKMDACVHLGKHGNLEWLLGKSVALSSCCFPELALGEVPHIYPFIVNDPGEGLQAKRRAQAVLIGHMTPPLTCSQTYGPLKQVETLIDEYYQAVLMDDRRLNYLKGEILSLVQILGLAKDLGIQEQEDDEAALLKIDAFLCDLKDLQIRNGLHIFGQLPEGEALLDFLLSLARLGDKSLNIPSLMRAIADDLLLDFDPITADLTEFWGKKSKPYLLQTVSCDYWRTAGDSVERIDLLAKKFLNDILFDKFPEYNLPILKDMPKTKEALIAIKTRLLPLLKESVTMEIANLLKALEGTFVPPGPSGAPTRGNLAILPTGRNFYGIDNRAMPTCAAWHLGKKSADLLVQRYVQDHGEWPKSFALNVWGTSNIRTGGDDIAQALALIGAQPIWGEGLNRVEGYEIIPLHILKRPRIDVFLRVSGFFRDAFPEQMRFFQEIITKIGQLDEAFEDNAICYHMHKDREKFSYLASDLAQKKASFRIFSSKIGTYGTAISEKLKNGEWEDREELGNIWQAYSCYAFDKGDMLPHEDSLSLRLEQLDAIVQNQDNREHDLLDSAEYYAFQGGLACATARYKSKISLYHNDLSRPDRPIIKNLEEELAQILHGRVLNPKWLKSIRAHGYRGGAELCAVVEHLFAFAVTTEKVTNEHFTLVFESFLQNEEIYDFLKRNNLPALKAIIIKFEEAIKRDLWQIQKNSVYQRLEEIKSSIC